MLSLFVVLVVLAVLLLGILRPRGCLVLGLAARVTAGRPLVILDTIWP